MGRRHGWQNLFTIAPPLNLLVCRIHDIRHDGLGNFPQESHIDRVRGVAGLVVMVADSVIGRVGYKNRLTPAQPKRPMVTAQQIAADQIGTDVGVGIDAQYRQAGLQAGIYRLEIGNRATVILRTNDR